ncbi:hypothetical protein [Sorangium sp. So ce124]|uniref:hypothetical protein n=1 Tax=Sorangium sp. So ce124 TaxID=3133280 RepID=UPI003F60991A
MTPSLYLRLEELHLRALALKIRIAGLSVDEDQIKDVDEILNTKIAELSQRVESAGEESPDLAEGS